MLTLSAWLLKVMHYTTERQMHFSSPASLTSSSLTDFVLFLLFFDFPHSFLGSPLMSCYIRWGMIEQCSLLCIAASHTHTHTHQPNPFPVMFSSCITCIPIRVQVPHGSYSGLKTSRAPGTSAPWSWDLPSLLLWREHLTASRGFFCCPQLAPYLGHWFSSQLSHPGTSALKPALFFWGVHC